MQNPKLFSIIWTDYFRHRIDLRGFDIRKIESILRHSEMRYFDVMSQRNIAVGKHDKRLVLIAYDKREDDIIPITIHATTRKQINFRLKTGRFIYE